MPTTVQGPDGQEFEFPDGTPPETMKAAMRKHYGAPQQQPAKPKGFLEQFASDFTEPYRQGKDAYARATAPFRQAIDQAYADPSIGNIGNAVVAGAKAVPGQIMGAAQQAGAVAGGGLINAIVKPATQFASNALEDAGIHAYQSPQRFPFDPAAYGKAPVQMGRDEAAQGLNNTVQTALSIGVPVESGPPKLRAAPKTTPRPKVNPDVALLRSHGVDILPGAARGGAAKNMEDRLAKLPLVGSKVQQAREGSIASFNKALVNDALKPIGKTLPSDIPAGHPANAHAYDTIQKAYRANQPAQPIIMPRDFADVSQHPDFGILAPESQAALDRIMNNRLLTKAPNGELDGRNFGKAVELLREDIKRTGQQGGEGQVVSGILKDKLDELISEASVQDPEFAARKEALDISYAKIKTLQKASQSLGADNGIVMPTQYMNAIKAADSSAGKNRFATGRAFNQDLAQAAKNVLSDKVANTGGEAGILGNAIMQTPTAVGAMIGGPVGAGAGFGLSTGGLYGASRLYEPAAIAKFNASLDRRMSGGVPRLASVDVNPGVDVSALPPLVAASNIRAFPTMGELAPLKAAAEPPRKRKRKR